MNLEKALYESPEVEEIVFISMDAIAASPGLNEGDDEDDQVGDDWFDF